MEQGILLKVGAVGKMKVRPFQPLLADMGIFLAESKRHNEIVENHDPLELQNSGSHAWPLEKSFGRAALVVGMAAIEALVNQVVFEYPKRTIDELPKSWLNSKQTADVDYGREFERWSLIDKIYFAPSLCHEGMKPPVEFWDREGEKYKHLRESIEIRNSIAHGKPLEITTRFEGGHKMFDDFPENFWPITKISRDICLFNYHNAKQTTDLVAWVKDELMRHLEDAIEPKFINTQDIQFLPSDVQLPK